MKKWGVLITLFKQSNPKILNLATFLSHSQMSQLDHKLTSLIREHVQILLIARRLATEQTSKFLFTCSNSNLGQPIFLTLPPGKLRPHSLELLWKGASRQTTTLPSGCNQVPEFFILTQNIENSKRMWSCVKKILVVSKIEIWSKTWCKITFWMQLAYHPPKPWEIKNQPS